MPAGISLCTTVSSVPPSVGSSSTSSREGPSLAGKSSARQLLTARRASPKQARWRLDWHPHPRRSLSWHLWPSVLAVGLGMGLSVSACGGGSGGGNQLVADPPPGGQDLATTMPPASDNT